MKRQFEEEASFGNPKHKTHQKRKALELAGWRFGNAADFLQLTEAEKLLIDARVEAALAKSQAEVKPISAGFEDSTH